MNIFFDVDETIIAYWGDTLRPLVKEVFEEIRLAGHLIYIWSGVGLRWSDIDKHGLRQYIESCYHKPLWDHRRALSEFGIEVEPHFVVDDQQDIVDVFGGHAIKPYIRHNPDDREMVVVLHKVLSFPSSPADQSVRNKRHRH